MSGLDQLNLKLKHLEIYALILVAIFCLNSFADDAVSDCKGRESVEQKQRLTELNSNRDKISKEQYAEEYKEIVKESRAVMKQCERDPAFVKPLGPDARPVVAADQPDSE